MLILLLIPQAERRQRLLALCASAGIDAQGIDPADVRAAVFSLPLNRVGLLVLDPESLRRQGFAMLASWRRMAPQSRLLFLSGDANEDLQRLQGAMR